MKITVLRTLPLLACAILISCGASTPEPSQPPPPNLLAFDCGSGIGSPPPAKLILHPGSGVPGRYMVVLRTTVRDLPSAAADLATVHNGSIFAVWASIQAFGINIADGEASPLSREASVCYVEQDAVATGA